MIQKLLLIYVLSFLFISFGLTQNVAVNNTGSPADSSAMLDIAADEKGLLIPRVSLAGLDDTSTIKSAATSLLVYNSATTNDVSPGYYYWNDTIWTKLSTLWKEGEDGIHYIGGNVGIGTKSPDHTFELATDGVATIYLTSYRETGYNAGHFVGRSARGSQAYPNSSLEGDFLGVFSAKGYGNTDFGPFNRSDARIALIAAEDFSDTTRGTDIAFFTTPRSQTGMLERLRIAESGNIGIGTSYPEELLTLRSGNSRIRAYTEHDNEASSLEFMRSRFNESSLDQNGGILGRIGAYGYDGTNYLNSASIRFATDGVVNQDSMPGSIEFLTLDEGDAEPELRMVIKSDGRVGVGTENPQYLLEVIGDSRARATPIAYFENTCDTVDGQLVDAFGVMGVSDQTDWAGYGVYGKGGFIGVRGLVTPIDTFSYFGSVGSAVGGGGENSGIYGNASGSGVNYGVQGRAKDGTRNFGVYGQVDQPDTEGNFAGYFDGNTFISHRLGIGTDVPRYPVDVIGNSGIAHTPIAYFENTCDTVDNQPVDAYGVMGVCDQTDWAGYGGVFRGGFVGVRGDVFPTDTFSYFGTRGAVNGGSGANYGLHGFATGDGTNTGVRGRAQGSDMNYGVWGYAKSGITNYAVYGNVDTTDVEGTYAGYFEGDVHMSDKLGIGTTTPDEELHVSGTAQVDSLIVTTGASDGYIMTSDASGNATWQAPSFVGMVPVGTILPWNKSTPGTPALPDEFVECNGQTISDAGSPLNGQAMPNLNGNGGLQRFLRGGPVSGISGGAETHTHTGVTDNNTQVQPTFNGAISSLETNVNHNHTFTTNQASSLPSYYEVVWIIRVK